MAQTVIIRIIDETEFREPTPTASSTGDGNTPQPNTKNKKSKEKEKDFRTTLYWAIGKRMVSVALDNAKYYAGKYYSMSENYMAQQAVENASNMISSFISIAGSAIAGGVAFGPWGAIAMAAIAVGNQVLGQVKAYESEVSKIVDNAYGNYFYGTRAGFVAGGHGTEN